jgi:hypothetical protein
MMLEGLGRSHQQGVDCLYTVATTADCYAAKPAGNLNGRDMTKACCRCGRPTRYPTQRVKHRCTAGANRGGETRQSKAGGDVIG